MDLIAVSCTLPTRRAQFALYRNLSHFLTAEKSSYIWSYPTIARKFVRSIKGALMCPWSGNT